MLQLESKMLNATLRVLAKVECADMFIAIQKMSVYIKQYLISVNGCCLVDIQKYLQENHSVEFAKYGIMEDDVLIAVAILFDEGLVDIDDSWVKIK